MTITSSPDAHILEDLLARARAAGADAADVLFARSTALSASVRLGETEMVELSESADIGLRIIKDGKQACISTSDLRADRFDELVERVMGMAAATLFDPHLGLADPGQLAANWTVPDLADPHEATAEELIKMAGDLEAAALAVPGVTNSEGGGASWDRTEVMLMASNGFHGGYALTSTGFGVTVLAGEGTNMEQDGAYESRRFTADLPSLQEAGRRAGERAVRKLGPRKGPTGAVPVIFAPEQASHLLMDFASSINGAAIARSTSFLKDRMGQAVFGPEISVVDDPFLSRGHRSKPFDAEGLLPQRRRIVEEGILTTWLLDLRSARQLCLAPTGHASRGVGGPPSPSATNMWMEPGQQTAEQLISEVKSGLYLTDILGHGLNLVTGDYSRGAMGIWIENGRLAYPVSEMTVAGNLRDMFLAMKPANDLTRRYGVDAPTVRIDGMTVAGV